MGCGPTEQPAAGRELPQVSSSPAAACSVGAAYFRLHSDWRALVRWIEKKRNQTLLRKRARALTPAFLRKRWFSGPDLRPVLLRGRGRGSRAEGFRRLACLPPTTVPLLLLLGPGSALTSRRDDAVARVFSENRARRLRASSGPTPPPPPYPFGWRVLARPAALLILRQRCCGDSCGLVTVADAAQVTVLCPLLVRNVSVASSFHSVLSPARVPAQLWLHATKEASHSRRHRNEKRRKCGSYLSCSFCVAS